MEISILVFKKCREHNDDILFIDASNNFEKRKNQNYLRDEDIDKHISQITIDIPDNYNGQLQL